MDDTYDSELEGIPEIELHAQIQPYMFEPTVGCSNNVSEDSTSESEEDMYENESEGARSSLIPDPSEWCTCNNCGPMPTRQESKCCRSIHMVNTKVDSEGLTCITEHEGFLGNCLNIHVLETSYFEFIQNEGLQEELVHETYRYIAYRRFARWIYHILPEKDRRIHPACVVTAIRKRFPSEQYCGFKYPQ